MPIILDHQLREQIPYDRTAFPVSYFHDELASLSGRASPLHWHPDFEIATAASGVLDFQVGKQHILLEAGDSIFVNRNVLHAIRQLSGGKPDPMPNVVFSGAVISPETGAICQKYISPVACCDALPFVVFRHRNARQNEVNDLAKDIYRHMRERGPCYEMAVQRAISGIFEYLFTNFADLPKSETARMHINAQIRLQKMLAYIYGHYAETVTLEDIARAANVGRSEAGRCFNAYMGCSPIEALIRYRLQIAHEMLGDGTLTLQEISERCGFRSVNYFSRRFRQLYGCAPGRARSLGK